MSELKTILDSWRPKKSSHSHIADKNVSSSSPSNLSDKTEFLEIPDIFFDQILVSMKLKRVEILILVHLYRVVWSRPNLYREYGISQMISYTDLSKRFDVELDEVYQSICKLESFSLIETIRPGQYFVRRFFLEEYDSFYGQSYGDFDL